MALVSLSVSIDFQYVNLARIGLVLHREKGQNPWLCSRGGLPHLLGEDKILLEHGWFYLDFGKANNPLAIFLQRNVLAEKSEGIVGEDVLRVQPMRGEALLQGLLSADEHRLGHVSAT